MTSSGMLSNGSYLVSPSPRYRMYTRDPLVRYGLDMGVKLTLLPGMPNCYRISPGQGS